MTVKGPKTFSSQRTMRNRRSTLPKSCETKIFKQLLRIFNRMGINVKRMSIAHRDAFQL